MTCEAPTAKSEIAGYTLHVEQSRLLGSCWTIEPHTLHHAYTMLDEIHTAWPGMYAHCVRTAALAQTMAQHLPCADEEIDMLTVAALLHDYGKIYELPRFQEYGRLSQIQQHDLRVAHVRSGFTAIRERVDEGIARIMIAHHEFPQPVSESYPRTHTDIPLFSHGNNRRTSPNETLTKLQALCALADQLDAMTDPERVRNNGLQLIQTESHILKNIQEGRYWPESLRSHVPELVHEALTTLQQTFLTQIR